MGLNVKKCGWEENRDSEGLNRKNKGNQRINPFICYSKSCENDARERPYKKTRLKTPTAAVGIQISLALRNSNKKPKRGIHTKTELLKKKESRENANSPQEKRPDRSHSRKKARDTRYSNKRLRYHTGQ